MPADVFQQPAHRDDVAHVGNVVERDCFRGENSRRHARQRRVLRAADRYASLQRRAATNAKLVHARRLKEKSQNRHANDLLLVCAIISVRTMKRLPNEERLLNPKPGSAAAAARDFGIDLSLTVENLRLTPEERIRRLDRARAMMKEVREAGRRARSRRRSSKST